MSRYQMIVSVASEPMAVIDRNYAFWNCAPFAPMGKSVIVMYADFRKKIGIKGFLEKPIVRSDLAKTVRNVIDEAKGKAQP